MAVTLPEKKDVKMARLPGTQKVQFTFSTVVDMDLSIVSNRIMALKHQQAQMEINLARLQQDLTEIGKEIALLEQAEAEYLAEQGEQITQ